MSARTAAVALAGVLALSGCATDVRGELRRTVANITEDANAGDADRVRRGTDDLLDQVDDAVRSNEIDPAEGARITELARLLKERAGLLEPEEPEPTPTPVEEPTEEPDDDEQEEPDEEPAPSPTRSPSPPPPSPTTQPSPPADDDEDEAPLPEVPGG